VVYANDRFDLEAGTCSDLVQTRVVSTKSKTHPVFTLKNTTGCDTPRLPPPSLLLGKRFKITSPSILQSFSYIDQTNIRNVLFFCLLMCTWNTKLLHAEKNARSNRLLNMLKSSDRYWWVGINSIGRPFRELMYALTTLN